MVALKAVKIEKCEDGDKDDYLILSTGAINDFKFELLESNHPLFNLLGAEGDENGKIKYDSNKPNISPLQLMEQTDYYFEISENIEFAEEVKNNCKFTKEGICGILNFKNYVGRATLIDGLDIEVRCKKMGYREDYEKMVDELTSTIINLAFHYNTPTSIFLQREEISKPTLFEDYIFIRYLMHEDRFPLFFEIIRNNPSRKMIVEDFNCDISQAYEITPRTIADMFMNPDRLIEPSKRITACATLQEKLHGKLPTDVVQTRKLMTFDTQENRFVKYFLHALARRVSEVRDGFLEDNEHKDKPKELLEDCDNWIDQLEEYIITPFLEDVGEMITFPASSQILQKQEGYRELFKLYLEFSLAGKVKWGGLEELIKIPNKNMATLYEYWVFFKIFNLMKDDSNLNLGENNIMVLTGENDEFTVNLKKGIDSEVTFRDESGQEEFSLYYNKKYPSMNPENGSENGSYSLGLAPDISIETGDKTILFDAKYKYDIKELDEEENEAYYEDIKYFEKLATRADIYKMHTYRDAIKNASAVFAIYPGDECKFYSVDQGEIDLECPDANFNGVGAIPLTPESAEADELKTFIKRLIMEKIPAHPLFRAI